MITTGSGEFTFTSTTQPCVLLIYDEPPIPPGNVTISAPSHETVMLGWDDNSNDEDGFVIQRKPYHGRNTWSDVGLTPPGQTTFTDTNDLHGETVYTYRVGSFK